MKKSFFAIYLLLMTTAVNAEVVSQNIEYKHENTAKIAAFQEGVGKAGADWQMIYYGGAVHSFTDPAADKKNIDGLAYNFSADSRSWKHMQLFFDEIF